MNTNLKLHTLQPDQFDFTSVIQNQQPRNQKSGIQQILNTDSDNNQCGRMNYVSLECYPPTRSDPNIQICTVRKWN